MPVGGKCLCALALIGDAASWAEEIRSAEYRLLAALIRHPGQTLAPDQLLELAWNDPLGIGPERVKFGIMRLRRKLGPGVAIEAVRGFGYRFVPPRLDRAIRPQLTCTGAATPAVQAGRMRDGPAPARGRILVVEDGIPASRVRAVPMDSRT